MLIVAAARLAAAASATASPASSVTGAAPATYLTFALPVSTGTILLTDTPLVTGADALTPSLTDQRIVQLEVVALAEA